MIACHKWQTYNSDHIYFLKSVKNAVILNGLFTKIIYSTSYASFTGLYLLLRDCPTEFLKTLEVDLLRKYSAVRSISKDFQLKLSNCGEKIKEMIQTGNHESVLKIAGVWESTCCIGLIYKIID